MTKNDGELLKKLIETKQKSYYLDRTPDSEILKVVVYNEALRDAIKLVMDYSEGKIHREVLEALNGN